MIKYTLKDKKDDIKDSVIVKTGDVAEFTLNEFESSYSYNLKALKEIEAKVKLEKATIKNIEKNHPFVKDLSEQDLHTAKMYYESKSFLKEGEPKLELFKEGVQKNIDDVKDIIGQIDDLKDIELNMLKDEESK